MAGPPGRRAYQLLLLLVLLAGYGLPVLLTWRHWVAREPASEDKSNL